MSGNSPENIVAALPERPSGPVRVETVTPGLTNRTYRLTFATETWMLRLPMGAVSRVGIDRDREIHVLERAADVGVAPPVIHADPQKGVLITSWVPGATWTPARLADGSDRERLAELLRNVHGMPPCGSVFAPTDLAESYVRLLSQSSELYADCRRAATELEQASAAVELRCCHNDLIAANVVGDLRPKLIDWEYACDNDPAFDLASLIEFHGLSERVADSLVAAYAPTARSEWRERVEEQRRIYAQLTVLWCAAYGDLENADVAALATRMQARLRR
ncbi:MAG: choline/ethanolamine kinase family protein [Pseudomonadota bacterium]